MSGTNQTLKDQPGPDNPEMQTLYVQGGACLLNNESGGTPTLQRCALEDIMCQDDEANQLVATFRSSRQLLQDGPNAVGYECLNAVPDIGLGRCRVSGGTPSTGKSIVATDAFACSSSRQTCLSKNSDFIPAQDLPEGECTVAFDRHPQRLRTRSLYGECSRVGTSTNSVAKHLLIGCYWSVRDCNEAEFVHFLSNPDAVEWQRKRTQDVAGWNEECTCENVSTGACQDKSGDFFCAVSQHGCDDEEGYFISSHHLPDYVRCRLCAPNQVAQSQDGPPVLSSLTLYPTAAPVVPGSTTLTPTNLVEIPPDNGEPTMNTGAPTLTKTTQEPWNDGDGSIRGNGNSSSNNDDGASPAGIVLGVLLPLSLLLVAAVMIMKWRRHRRADDASSSQPTSEEPQEQAEGVSRDEPMVSAGVFG